MKLYEKCELKISPEFGFGEKGFPPKMIQPGATLLFEVELLKWKSDDVTERKDGGVLKRLMVEGDVEGAKLSLRIHSHTDLISQHSWKDLFGPPTWYPTLRTC